MSLDHRIFQRFFTAGEANGPAPVSENRSTASVWTMGSRLVPMRSVFSGDDRRLKTDVPAKRVMERSDAMISVGVEKIRLSVTMQQAGEWLFSVVQCLRCVMKKVWRLAAWS